ncbi:expressed unknown protein [Seminavis robusta]|uniref:Zn(2)-C6 fungal-type domain-containing protein n=1 Tax=Seminavis robusta TaxID=568900 RepID=A0A9N8EBQ6_9STRA|nr:expressed unknown protein [Seminavis robusta]|eukprot:Sro772_g200310.1 n/a (720) ;mRNA; r:35348-38243
MATDDLQHKNDGSIALCASCDRCRSRKTKCDGKRPCGNCANKYMKKHKLSSIEGVDFTEFECVYSPAKRRGPVPGKSGQTRKAGDAFTNGTAAMDVDQPPAIASSSDTMAQQVQQMIGSTQMTLIQKLQQQAAGSTEPMQQDDSGSGHRSAQRVRREVDATTPSNGNEIPKTIASHTHLLDRNDAEGNRLRSYYRLSIDELYRLPLTPENDEYCAKWNAANPGKPSMTAATMPKAHLAALSASRFAEVALGAVVHQELSMAMELCNAVVHCLRECVAEPVQDSYLFEVTRAYFLLGVFRACRGDMERYFKYRRVAMTYAAKLPDATETQVLMAAVSYLDAWAYMIYNADEEKLPAVDGSIPSAIQGGCGTGACSKIASDPQNQNWIQGAPPVYLNNEAPLPSRALDALACAVRTCCDQANSRFAAVARAAERGEEQITEDPNSNAANTPTTTAVLANNNELCSRNLILSAFTLMQQHESLTAASFHKNRGQRMVISAMDAFLENNEDDESGGFTDSQIQSLLSVCNTAIENPFLLYHAGPSYHMVTNAAVLLCHLLNGMYAEKIANGAMGEMEAAMFEEALDTFIAVRKLLTIHRRKLPVKLRCHGIPRPTFDILVKGGLSSAEEQEQFPNINSGKFLIDLGETVLCACRGCQGFVLMACSPCVAAERAMAAQDRLEEEDTKELDAIDQGDLDRELDDLGNEFNLDDDALLGMISQLIH